MVMRSPERGQTWDNIAAALNSLQQPKLRVTASLACEQALLFGRVRDEYSLLTSKQKQKLRDEEEASRIE